MQNQPALADCLALLISNTNLCLKAGAKLLELFPSLTELFNLSAYDLQRLGFSKDEINGLKNPDWQLVEQSLNWSQQLNHQIISLADHHYPSNLKNIANPPLLLFLHGNIELLNKAQLAVVGSRNPTTVGRDNAFVFARELAASGLVITSGLATGIDAASHQGSLAVAGHTIAVMGTSLRQIYPRCHIGLAEQIVLQGGLLISELPFNVVSKPWHFPLRNRIISGLSLGCLVVEATIKSGSLITARLANEQGREVFAIPGSIHNPLARGTNYLIQQGAKLVQTSAEILSEFPSVAASIQPAPRILPGHKKQSQKAPIRKTATNNIAVSDCYLLPGLTIPQDSKNPLAILENKQLNNKEFTWLTAEHKVLLHYIDCEYTIIDNLLVQTGFSVALINQLLLDLELAKLINNEMGRYSKTTAISQ